jgi:hypothetical protein
MNALVLLGFSLPVLSGFLMVHLLWPDRQVENLLLKFFLGVGVGLGASSVQYFLYLFFFAGRHWFVFLELIEVGSLLVAAFFVEWKRRQDPRPGLGLVHFTSAQRVFVAAGAIIFLISLLGTASYLLRRRQGDWDAWMMYNRAARFVYRDPAHWLQSFSPRMDPIFHADYPLLLAMNISSGWELAGSDSPHVPMVQSALFALGCVGLLVTALLSVKSPGQAALGLVILWGAPLFVNEGARQMADVPLAFYILATAVLIYLYVLHKNPGLLVVAGLTTGFAAWTKNEGSAFVIAVLAGLALAFGRSRRWSVFLWWALGLAPPLAAVLYFKLRLAPPSDVLSSGPSRSIQQILDPARHFEILRYFWGEITGFGNWGIAWLPLGIMGILALYFLLFRAPIPTAVRPAFKVGLTLLTVQAAGYYGIYLITPYDLAWHLSYSSTRVLLQVFPLILFLVLAASATPESVYGPPSADRHGVQHASSD